MGFEYEGGSMTDWVRAAKVITEETCHELVDAGTKRWKHITEINTPIERFIKPVTTKPPYHLRNSWEIGTLRVADIPGEDAAKSYEADVYTEVEYAPYVEEGTGLWGPEHRKYVIRPKRPGGWLSWIARDTYTRRDGSIVKAGDRVYAKEVLHPGSPGQHMLAIGAHMTQEQFDEWADDIMAGWAARVERAAQ